LQGVLLEFLRIILRMEKKLTQTKTVQSADQMVLSIRMVVLLVLIVAMQDVVEKLKNI